MSTGPIRPICQPAARGYDPARISLDRCPAVHCCTDSTNEAAAQGVGRATIGARSTPGRRGHLAGRHRAPRDVPAQQLLPTAAAWPTQWRVDSRRSGARGALQRGLPILDHKWGGKFLQDATWSAPSRVAVNRCGSCATDVTRPTHKQPKHQTTSTLQPHTDINTPNKPPPKNPPQTGMPPGAGGRRGRGRTFETKISFEKSYLEAGPGRAREGAGYAEGRAHHVTPLLLSGRLCRTVAAIVDAGTARLTEPIYLRRRGGFERFPHSRVPQA